MVLHSALPPMGSTAGRTHPRTSTPDEARAIARGLAMARAVEWIQRSERRAVSLRALLLVSDGDVSNRGCRVMPVDAPHVSAGGTAVVIDYRGLARRRQKLPSLATLGTEARWHRFRGNSILSQCPSRAVVAAAKPCEHQPRPLPHQAARWSPAPARRSDDYRFLGSRFLPCPSCAPRGRSPNYPCFGLPRARQVAVPQK